jgi:hypothetical protein
MPTSIGSLTTDHNDHAVKYPTEAGFGSDPVGDLLFGKQNRQHSSNDERADEKRCDAPG